MRRDLHRVEPLEPQKRITNQPVPLDKVPLEAKDDLYLKATKIFEATPDAQTQVLKLAVQDVKQLALENNLGLKVDKIASTVSNEQFEAESWKFEPIVDVALNRSRAHDTLRFGTTTTVISPQVTIPDHLGGTVTVSFPTSIVDSDVPTFDSMGNQSRLGKLTTLSPEIALSQPLLRGGGLRVAYASVEQAGLRAGQASSRARLSAIRTLTLAEQSYWRYYAAYERLRIQMKKYETAKEQLRFAKRLVEEGARTKVEVTRAAASVARELNGVIAAELTRRQAERDLKRAINSKDATVSSAVTIQPSTAPAPVQLEFDRAALMKLAMEKRMDLFQSSLQLGIDEADVDVATSFALPGVNLDLKYGSSATDDLLIERSASDFLFKTKASVWSAGVVLDIGALFGQAGWARQRAALAQLRQDQTVLESVRQGIELEVLNAVDAVELTWQQVLASRQALAIAAEDYESEKLLFAAGNITSADLLIQLDNLTNARLSVVQAQSDYQNAMVDLAFATGTITSESGVVWQDG